MDVQIPITDLDSLLEIMIFTNTLPLIFTPILLNRLLYHNPVCVFAEVVGVSTPTTSLFSGVSLPKPEQLQ